MHGQHGHEPTRSWQLARDGLSAATAAWPCCRGAFPEGTAHPAGQQLPGQGSVSPRLRARGPWPVASGGGGARGPCQAGVSQQWGPIGNEMFLLGYFICTLQ